MSMLLAVPKQGLTPRDPRTRLVVPPEGVLVPEHDPYWRDLERFGDIQMLNAPKLLEAEAQAPAASDPSPAGQPDHDPDPVK